MTFKKLLAAVSIAALSIGSANALTLAPGSATANGVTMASNIDFTTPQTATFDWSLTPDGTWPTGDNVFARIELPAGVTFGGTTNFTGTGTELTNATGTVSTGGTVGDNFVEVVLTPTSPTAGITFQATLSVSGCAGLGGTIEASMVTFASSGIVIEGGSASSDPMTPLVGECVDVVTATVTDDSTAVGAGPADDTQISLASNFLDINSGPNGPTTPAFSPSTVGSVALAVAANAATSLANTANVSAADINSVVFDLVFDDASAFVPSSTASVTSVPAGDNHTFTYTSATGALTSTGGVDLRVAVDNTNTTALNTQALEVSDIVVAFTSAALDDVTLPGGSVDTLQREGQTFGPFDWNGGNPNSTLSVYRATGFTPGASVDYTVIMTNSPVDGVYPGTATAGSAGEIVLTSRGFGAAAVPAYVRGDAEFNFETSNSIDVDRLMIRDNVVSSFGGSANWNATTGTSNDADNTSGSE